MRALKVVLQVALGLAVGLGLAELAFSARDDGAFPHVNLYRLDPELGARLEPNASMRLRVADNPVTTVRTNTQGYRAPEWPAPSKDEVLVVGDSQVFGLGVEAEATFSAQLAQQLGRPVLNAGVPTYGPREYTAVVKSVLAQRPGAVGTVVYVLNLANDLFEVNRPNAARHAVWDGWAVRTETAPSRVTEFPFRREVMSRSHLVFALRQLLHAQGEATNEGLPTEGSWKDLVQSASGVTPPPDADAEQRARLERRAALSKALDEVADAVEQEVVERIDAEDDPRFAAAVQSLARKGDPRDIVQVRYAEGARAIDVTAYQLLRAAVGEARNDALLEKAAATKNDPTLAALLAKRRELRAQLAAVDAEDGAVARTALEQVLHDTKALCDAAGARLLVVALPLDVMVSPEEWAKYGVAPLDMSPTRALVDDVVARARRVGALAVDPTEALAAAEPGAFLHGDLHLTPKGHAALAARLAAALSAPPPSPSALALPEGRSWPPTEDEWRAQQECVVKGSTAANCETRLVREWLRLDCHPQANEDGSLYNPLEVIEVREGGHGDARVDHERLVIPLLEGDQATVRFAWRQDERVLSLAWPRGGERVMAFGAPTKRVVTRADRSAPRRSPPGHEPTEAAACPEGRRPGGAFRVCAKACDAATPCAVGHCEPWPSGDFCAVP